MPLSRNRKKAPSQREQDRRRKQREQDRHRKQRNENSPLHPEVWTSPLGDYAYHRDAARIIWDRFRHYVMGDIHFSQLTNGH